MLTRNGGIYVTKLKKKLKHTVQKDIMHMNEEGQMDYRTQYVMFTKEENEEKIITYVGIKKTRAKLIPLLTNDMEVETKAIVDIYRKKWEIELLFKQLKQNFPLRYFYGESCFI